MSQAEPENPDAFPVPPDNVVEGSIMRSINGMTLRDYFAAKAMAAFITANGNHGHNVALGKTAEENKLGVEEFIAMASYEQADAMLAERAKSKEAK